MSTPPPLATTTVRCLRCGVAHPATIERENGQIFGSLSCPKQPDKVRLSSDAELYQAIRSKSRCLGASTIVRRSVVYLLPITDTCNFRCPVCYAACEPRDNPAHLPVSEVLSRAQKARAQGARAICITGGEPTMHPELPQIIRLVRRTGAKVFLITNGLRLGTEPGLAGVLRAAGLSKVDLQFDTLNAEVHRKLRGNAFIEEKVDAAKNVVAAGIRLGTVTTVTRLNLPEVEQLITFGLSLGAGLKTIMFQTAAPVGRFEIGREQLVDKEQILKQVLASRVLPRPTVGDVWPFPHVPVWGMRVHPDCGVSLVFFRDDTNGLRPAGDWIDLPRLNEELHRLAGKTHWWARNMGPLRCLLKATRSGHRLDVLRNLAGFLSNDRKPGAVLIGISSFCSPEFVDELRLQGCATSELRAGGAVSPCACYLNPGLLDKSREKGILESLS